MFYPCKLSRHNILPANTVGHALRRNVIFEGFYGIAGRGHVHFKPCHHYAIIIIVYIGDTDEVLFDFTRI
jgi:hypothetical protein